MVTIARNRALDEVRKKGHLRIDDEPGALEVADPLPLASDTIEQNDDRQRLGNCLDKLEPERRDIVNYCLSGYDFLGEPNGPEQRGVSCPSCVRYIAVKEGPL